MFINEGTLDRVFRVLLGVAILFLLPKPWNWLGLVPLLTGVAGFCPLYRLFGMSTCPARTAKGA